MTYWHDLRGWGNVGGRRGAGWRVINGKKLDNCKSIINKIYFKNDLNIAPCAYHLKSNYLPSPSIRPHTFLLPSHPSYLWQPPHCCLGLWVSVLCPTREWNHMFLSFFWLIPLSIIFSSSIHITDGSYFIFSYSWVVFHRIYVPHLLYPVLWSLLCLFCQYWA